MSDIAVELQAVGRSHVGKHGTMQALRNVDLRVKRGEFLVIVGPSGCGKSSLLNLIAGLDRPTEGKILIDGAPRRWPGADRIMVFQEHALFPFLDVVGNVEFGLRMAGVPPVERRERALEFLRMVQLEKFMHHRPHELSGGMKQRVALARALVVKPAVLLMDEPFAALDAQTRDDLQGKLQELWLSQRPTTVFVTHNVREAACLGDRVVVMSHRPGTVKTSFELDIPRPREVEDERVIAAARQIKAALADEITWARERDLGIEVD